MIDVATDHMPADQVDYIPDSVEHVEYATAIGGETDAVDYSDPNYMTGDVYLDQAYGTDIPDYSNPGYMAGDAYQDQTYGVDAYPTDGVHIYVEGDSIMVIAGDEPMEHYHGGEQYAVYDEHGQEIYQSPNEIVYHEPAFDGETVYADSVGGDEVYASDQVYNDYHPEAYDGAGYKQQQEEIIYADSVGEPYEVYPESYEGDMYPYEGHEYPHEVYPEAGDVIYEVAEVIGEPSRLRANRTVTFNANGGSPNTTRTVSSGQRLGNLPANPTRAGHTFAGWFTTSAATGGSQVNANTIINVNTTFWARWNAQNITVSFNAQGGSVSPTSRQIRAGSQIGALPNPTRAGHTFTGWFSAATGGAQIFATTTTVLSVTLFARWNAQNFTVTFNANGGSPNTTRSVQGGRNVGTLPANPTRAGHTFAGWFNTSAATGGAQVTANTIINGNTTVWARWTAQNITITFNANGGSVSPTTRQIRAGAQIGTLPNPTRAGHTSVGWFSAATGGAQIFATTTTVLSVTLFARWNVANFTVTFNANGGSPNTTRSVQGGRAVGALPANPTRMGHTFAGWFTASVGGAAQIFATTTTALNVTLFARWTVQTATVTFNANGGTPSSSRNVNVGSQLGGCRLIRPELGLSLRGGLQLRPGEVR